MTATYTLNAEKNGIEITFDSKPAAAILEAIKSAGYRWSRARRIWWAKQSPKALEAAQAVAKGHMNSTEDKDTAPAPGLWERTRWTPGPGGDECHAHTVGSNYRRGLSNKEIAATVKRELSHRFPSIRWSVTTKGYNSITVYLKSGPYENHKEVSRRDWKDASPELFAIMDYAENLLASYNWDDSDPYSDYSSRNFYDFVEVYGYQQTEPTEAQRQEIETFRARLEEEKRKEEERREQEWKAEQARRDIEAQEAAKREEKRRAIIAELTAAATVRALEPSEQYIIPAAPFARKAADLEEARQAAEKTAVDVSDCIILEEITAPADILTKWGESGGVLYDIPELFRAVGGSRTFDPRVESMTDYHQMDKRERETVKWYTLAAAIYTDTGELWAVVDDEGYTYARYIAVAPWEGSAERLPVPQDQGPDDETRAQAERVEDTSTAIIERLGLTGGGWETSPEYAQQMEPIMEEITVDTIRAVTIEPLKEWLYRRQGQRQAVGVRQYKEIMTAVHAAARAYARRTGARLNTTDTTPVDIAAAAYIIARETPQRPGELHPDHIRRAAYEAVRRATRAQQRHYHTDTPEDREEAAQVDADPLEAIAVRQAIQQAGHVAALLAQGYTPADIARRLRVSPSTAWRLAQRAREKVREALDIGLGK